MCVCVFHAFSLSLTLSLSISLPPPLFLSLPSPTPPLSHSLSSLTFVRARILLIALTNRISPWESLYSDRRVNAYYSKGISSRTHSLRCVSKFLTVTYLRYASKSLTRALVDEILLLLFNLLLFNIVPRLEMPTSAQTLSHSHICATPPLHSHASGGTLAD